MPLACKRLNTRSGHGLCLKRDKEPRMRRRLKRALMRLPGRYVQRICRQEFEAQKFKRFNERAVEFAFIFRALSRLYPRTVLDVGTGRRPCRR